MRSRSSWAWRAMSAIVVVAVTIGVSSAYVTDYRGALLEGAKWGYIDTAGRVVIELKFDEAKGFAEGRAAVRVGERWGYVNVRGELAIAVQYDAEIGRASCRERV